ncbi:hypothetical protein D3C85_1684650 [compost metagenome]
MAAEIFGDKNAHLRDMRQHFRRLSNESHINVAQSVAPRLNAAPGFTQQLTAVRTFKGRIGVREQFADIAERCRAEQGVG